MQTRRHKIEWVLLGTLLLVVGALVGYFSYYERNQIESRERDRLQTQARVIDENLGRQLTGINNALDGIRDEFPLPLGQSEAQTASRHLKALRNALPGVRTMAVFDREGTVVACNREELIGRKFSEQEYFRIPRERPDQASLYVSSPFKTALGVFSINVTRVATDPRGRFAGIVSATLDPEYFRVALGSVLYAPDMWASLAHEDGKVFVFMPPNEQALGVNLNKPGSFRARHVESGQIATVMTGTSTRTGEERMMAQHTLRVAGINMDKTLGIAVSRDLAAIYAPWRRVALINAALFLAFALASILGLAMFQRRRIAQRSVEARILAGRRHSDAILRQSAERLRELSQRLIESEDKVRRNINRELHDRVGAHLAALNLSLSILRSQLSEESLRRAGSRLDDTQKLLEETTNQVRDLMADLHPPALDDYGLHAALRTYANQLAESFPIPISLTGDPFLPRLPPAVEMTLFRVAQGALVNAITHAQATHIQVLLTASAERASLTIADDGCGFDLAHDVARHSSWGLAIMRERAEAVGAEFTVESTPGEGTRVRVEIAREKR